MKRNNILKAVVLTAVMLTTSAIARDPAYPNPERFKQYNIQGTDAYMLIDTQTGCEYLTRSDYSSYTLLEGTCRKDKGK